MDIDEISIGLGDREVVAEDELYEVHVEKYEGGVLPDAWLELRFGLDGIALGVDGIDLLIKHLTLARNRLVALQQPDETNGREPGLGSR